MRTLLRCLLIAILVASLTEAPALAAPMAPLGTVLQAQRAHVDEAPAAAGTTLYGGDRISTENGGTLQVRLGDARLYLDANSVAELTQTASGTRAELTQGTVMFSSTSSAVFELFASQTLFRSRSDAGVLAQVRVLNPLTFEVACERGELEVTIGKEVHYVQPGNSYRVTVELEQAPQGAGSGQQNPPQHAGKSKWLGLGWPLLLLIGGATGAVVYLLIRSPSHP